MATNNQGITHLARKTGGEPVCRRPRTIMSVTTDKFEHDPKQCKRCAAFLAKWRAKRKTVTTPGGTT